MGPLASLRSLSLPFHLAPLLLVSVFATLLLAGARAGLPGLPILLIVGSWFCKYAFMLLDHAAEGRPGAPVLSADDINPLGETRPLAYGIAIAVFYAASAGLGEYLGPAFKSAVRLLGLLSLPVVIATHTITGSFARSLHPVAVAETARGLGIGYLLVLGVVAACVWLGEIIVFDAGSASLWLRIALLMLLWLMMFSLLGGVIHARRLELGFEPEHSPERRRLRDQRDRDRERDRFIDQVFAEYRSGSSRNAWDTIKARAERGPDRVAEYAWIHERVASWSGPRLANRVAQELLPLLLSAGRNGEALRLVENRLRSDPQFHPLSGDDAIRIAQLARDGGNRPLARSMLREFELRFPDHPSHDTARLLASQLDNR
jgi:hypothetical protein